MAGTSTITETTPMNTIHCRSASSALSAKATRRTPTTAQPSRAFVRLSRNSRSMYSSATAGDDSLSIIMGEMWESQIRVRTDTERSATGDSNRQLSLLVEGVIELFTGHNFNRDASNLPVNRSAHRPFAAVGAFGASLAKARPSPEAGGFWLAARNL